MGRSPTSFVLPPLPRGGGGGMDEMDETALSPLRVDVLRAAEAAPAGSARQAAFAAAREKLNKGCTEANDGDEAEKEQASRVSSPQSKLLPSAPEVANGHVDESSSGFACCACKCARAMIRLQPGCCGELFGRSRRKGTNSNGGPAGGGDCVRPNDACRHRHGRRQKPTAESHSQQQQQRRWPILFEGNTLLDDMTDDAGARKGR